MNTVTHPFTDEELIVIFEAANQSIGDANIFDTIAEKLDLSDKEMSRIADKLYEFMNT